MAGKVLERRDKGAGRYYDHVIALGAVAGPCLAHRVAGILDGKFKVGIEQCGIGHGVVLHRMQDRHHVLGPSLRRKPDVVAGRLPVG